MRKLTIRVRDIAIMNNHVQLAVVNQFAQPIDCIIAIVSVSHVANAPNAQWMHIAGPNVRMKCFKREHFGPIVTAVSNLVVVPCVWFQISHFGNVQVAYPTKMLIGSAKSVAAS